MSHCAGVDAHRCACAPQWDKDHDHKSEDHEHCDKGHDKCGKDQSALLAMLEQLAIQQSQDVQSQADRAREEAIQEARNDPEPTPEQLQDLRERLGLPPLPVSLQMQIDDKAPCRA